MKKFIFMVVLVTMVYTLVKAWVYIIACKLLIRWMEKKEKFKLRVYLRALDKRYRRSKVEM